MGHSAHRTMAGALLLALALAGQTAVVPAGVRATGGTPSTTELWLPDLNPKPVGRTTDLIASIQPGGAAGSVTFYDDDNGDRTSLGSAPVTPDPYIVGGLRATLTLPADMALGAYHIVAVYSGDDTYAGSESGFLDFVVGPRPTTTQLTVSSAHDPSGATAQQGDQVTVMTQVLDAGSYTPNQLPITGTLTIKVDGVTKATIDPNSGTTLDTTGWTVGTHTIAGVYDPGSSTDYVGSSGSKNIDVVTNVVEVAGVGSQYGTFYPYKDRYRDTTVLRGTRNEPASVAIKVISPTGKTVKTASVALGTGTWSVVWNGRNSSGTMLAAGKYTVRQTITDAHLARVTYTTYVTLSAKRLYTYSATYTKNSTQVAKKTSTWVAWSFTLPAATVYKGLTFSIYGKDSAGSGGFGPHDYAWCSASTWHPGCATRWKPFPTTTSWKSVGGSVTADRSGRSVRLYAWGGYGNTRVTYGRVKVTYAILK